MEKRLSLTCEEGPKPRAKSFFTKDLFGAKASSEARARHGKVWSLFLGDREVRLLDDSNCEVRSFPRERVETVIRLPFTQWDPEGIVNLGVLDEEGSYFWFSRDKAVIREIKRYVDQTLLLSRGSKAYAHVFWIALSGLLGGPLIIIFGLLAMAFLNWAHFFGANDAPGIILVAPLLAGFAAFAFGIRSLCRLLRLRAAHKELISSGTGLKTTTDNDLPQS